MKRSLLLLVLPLLFAAAASARADSNVPLRSPSDMTTLTDVDAAASMAQRQATDCADLRLGIQIALDSEGTVFLPTPGGFHAITTRHVEELVARLRLLHLTNPESLGAHRTALAQSLNIPEFTLDGILDSDSFMADAAVPAIMTLLRERFAGEDTAAREKMAQIIKACLEIEAMAQIYTQTLEERRTELWAGGSVKYEGGDLAINGIPLDICLPKTHEAAVGASWPCEAYAAQVFCESKGHLVQLGYTWDYMSQSAMLDGTMCDSGPIAGCSGFISITCGNDPAAAGQAPLP